MEDNKELLDILSKEENIDAVLDIIYSKENLINHIINPNRSLENDKKLFSNDRH